MFVILAERQRFTPLVLIHITAAGNTDTKRIQGCIPNHVLCAKLDD